MTGDMWNVKDDLIRASKNRRLTFVSKECVAGKYTHLKAKNGHKHDESEQIQ
jgi:hypothetical protein